VEVHGSIRTSSCLACGTVVPFDEVLGLLPVPACPTCGRVLKPDVVLFGELLPEAAIARATQLAAQAGVLLVVGSSLEVYPVAGLPLETLAAGGALALVNRGGTQFDSRASVTIDAGAGETLRALADALLERP
jgi:NAD-dependent deacetylase